MKIEDFESAVSILGLSDEKIEKLFLECIIESESEKDIPNLRHILQLHRPALFEKLLQNSDQQLPS